MQDSFLIHSDGAYGHRAEYVGHFLKYIAEHDVGTARFHFVVSKQILAAIEESFDLTRFKNCQFQTVEYRNTTGERPYRDAMELLQEQRERLYEAIDASQPSRLIFLEMDKMQLLLATLKRKYLHNARVSGILFQPFVQEPRSPARLLKVTRKYLQLLWVLRNRAIDSVFILNDRHSVQRLNSLLAYRPVFRYLCDPIELPQFQSIDVRQKYKIDSHRTLLVAPGAVSERKNFRRLIAALKTLPDDLRDQAAVLIVGRCTEDSLDQFLRQASGANELQVVYRNEFVSTDEYESIVAQSDWVLALHVGFYWSSGTIGHAAAHNKGLIATMQGLIGRLVSENKLGLVADPYSEADIARQVKTALGTRHSASAESREFNMRNSAKEFVANVLSVPPEE